MIFDGNLDNNLDSVCANPKGRFVKAFEQSKQKPKTVDPTENLNVPSTEIAIPTMATTCKNKQG